MSSAKRSTGGRVKGVSKKKTSRPAGAKEQNTVRVCFAAAAKDGSLVHSVPDQDEWGPFADTVYNEILSVLSKGSRGSSVKGISTALYAVVVVDVIGGGAPPVIGNELELRTFLAGLLDTAKERISTAPSNSSPVWTRSASALWSLDGADNTRQLRVRLLLVEGSNHAIDACDEMASGSIDIESGERGKRSSANRVARIKEVLDQRESGDYKAVRDRLQTLFDLVRAEVAERLTPELNRMAAQTPHRTYEEKKELSKWVNAELRRFGLVLECPKTRLPCILVAGPGNRPEAGRFLLYHVTKSGHRMHTVTSVEMPALKLALDDMARVPHGSRRDNDRSR